MPHHAPVSVLPFARSVLALILLAAAAEAQTVITPAVTSSSYPSLASGSYILNSGATYEVTADVHGVRITGSNVTLSIQGTLQNDVLLSTDSDAAALRITGGSGVTGVNVTVGAVGNTDATILSRGNDAVKFTAVGTSAASPNLLTNYGTIRSEGAVNTSGGSANTYQVSDGVTMGVNTQINNYGTVSGARHGLDGGAITGVTVNNYAGAFLIGRNGSGIGADTTSALPSNYVVNNAGTIRGDYAGVGNIRDRANAAQINGDGDGIDIDGAATINNFATGQILSTGAGGFDSGTRANNSEAISIGGGIITNDGLIRGADRAIIVNNDSVANRSGIAASTITNNATGTIQGLNGFAIRLENKTGTSADDDTIVNAGTIIGNGTIPDPSAIVTLQGGGVDTNSTGTLNGVTYTGTGSARFIRGDGSAIQMGEGNDTLTNTGTITGNSGRAVNLEGGNDTFNFTSGTVTGLINGGTGTNTLNLGAGVAHGGLVQSFQNINVASGTATLSNTVSGTTLAKGGAGTLNLTAANDYTGDTIVSAGTLRVNNSTGSATGTGNVLLADGATLAGAGTIAGNVTASGILAPGNSVGTLTVGGDLTWNGILADAWKFELGSGNTSDRLVIGSDFLKGTGANFYFDFLGDVFTGTFVLASWTDTTTFTASDFNYQNLAPGLSANFAIQGKQLQVTVVPEPSTAVALLGSSVMLLSTLRRRRSSAV